ncbi:MAG: single-stranded DNA-binding protein [Spirochaetes bacterium]|nr:MAG: single-stranded DNA-binding protein [Spirochaetota bacterium]
MSARVTIVGTAAREAEVKVSQGGNSYAKFSVATRSGKKDKDGNWMADYWWECVGFGPIVDQISALVRRGSYLEVDGKFGFEEYTKKDGTRGQKFTCTVERIAEKEKPTPKVPSLKQPPEVNPFMQGLVNDINFQDIPF